MNKYTGWIFSLVLLAALIFVIFRANGTTAKLNDQLRAQADNFTAYYAALVAQRNAGDAQWQITLNTTLAAHDAGWQDALTATVAQRDAYWKSSIDALNSAMAVRDTQWKNTVDTTVAALNAQWKINVDAALAVQANYYNSLLAQYGVPQ